MRSNECLIQFKQYCRTLVRYCAGNETQCSTCFGVCLLALCRWLQITSDRYFQVLHFVHNHNIKLVIILLVIELLIAVTKAKDNTVIYVC